MTLLSRYILKQFLRMVFLCQSGAITLFLIAEFIERIDDFIEENATLARRSPVFSIQNSPSRFSLCSAHRSDGEYFYADSILERK